MPKNTYLILLIVASIALVTWWTNSHTTPKVNTLENEASSTLKPLTAPDFAFKTLSGENHSLASFKGKIVLLHFWATWCAPCVHEFPKLTAMADRFKDDIVVIALSSDSDKSAIDKFLLKQRVPTTMHVAQDQRRAITHDLYQTFAYPETIVINRNGDMIKKIAGDADWLSDDMTAYLKKLIDKR